MGESMGGQFVPTRDDLARQVGVQAHGHPEREEARLDTEFVEEIEHHAGLALERLTPDVPAAYA
jgi:hypothetical protein